MKDVGEIQLLESVLTYLVNKTYTADTNEIISMFDRG